MNLLRQRQACATPRGDEMEFDASVMLLFGGTKASVSQVGCSPRAIGARATSEHHWDGINQTVVSLADLPRAAGQQFFDEQLKGRDELIQAAVDTLISGQSRKPLAPMIANVIIDAALGGAALQMPEQIHGYEFLVPKQRAVVIAQALLFQNGMSIVEVADEQVEFDKFVFHKLNLINSLRICLFYS